MTLFEERAIAMAAQFQAAQLAHACALGHTISEDALACVLRGLYIFNVNQASVLYEVSGLKLGLATFHDFLNKTDSKKLMPVLRYAFGFGGIAKLLERDAVRSDRIRQHLKKHAYQLEHFEITHPNILGNLSELYLKTISTLPRKILLVGQKEILGQPAVLEKIRAILLAGVRAGFQWRSLGGRGWHCIVYRKQLLNATKSLLLMHSELPQEEAL